MSTPKEKIRLNEEAETLLITLYSKAIETQRPDPILVDKKALEIVNQVDYDFNLLKVPQKTVAMVLLRARKMDGYTRDFLARYPQSLVLHLGCGLDSRCLRVAPYQGNWYDLDFPDVISLRRKFYQENDNYHMIATPVTDLSWIDQVEAQGRPVLVLAEGLMMYLREAEVKSLVLRLKEIFPGCHLVFDVFSQMTAKSVGAHPSLQKTGASVYWGIDDNRQIESWEEGIQLQEEWFFTQSEALDKFSPGFRLALRLAGLIPAARKAHRILFFTL
jgi:O-methyltransferase involved in polyketide biosynthesis